MRVFITGVTGFAGTYLARILKDNGYDIYGVSLEDSDDKNIYKGDINNKKYLYSLLDEVSPDIIYHLAATTSVRRSWEIPTETINNNFIVSLNIMDWVKNKNTVKLFIMGSGEIYGNKTSFPVKEVDSIEPLTPYSLSKYLAEKTAVFFSRNLGIKIYLSRAFNFTGPGQRDVFVIPSFSKQLVEMELGLREKVLKVGNLNAIRDFTDVRDTAKAIYLITEKGIAGEPYNIASGKSYSIEQLLSMLLEFVDFKVKIIRNESEFRKNDILKLEGSYEKLFNDTGWKPEIDIKTTLKDSLDYWRKNLSERES
jgi:GDP-4-dehydro-6-deoxy-D-mannose reductase